MAKEGTRPPLVFVSILLHFQGLPHCHGTYPQTAKLAAASEIGLTASSLFEAQSRFAPASCQTSSLAMLLATSYESPSLRKGLLISFTCSLHTKSNGILHIARVIGRNSAGFCEITRFLISVTKKLDCECSTTSCEVMATSVKVNEKTFRLTCCINGSAFKTFTMKTDHELSSNLWRCASARTSHSKFEASMNADRGLKVWNVSRNFAACLSLSIE